jgi:hypothetical protein
MPALIIYFELISAIGEKMQKKGAVREWENPQREFEKQLESYYALLEDRIDQSPPEDFFKEGAKRYGQLSPSDKERFRKLKKAHDEANTGLCDYVDMSARW